MERMQRKLRLYKSFYSLLAYKLIKSNTFFYSVEIMPRDVYIWVRVPVEVYDIWVNKLSRSDKREIGKEVAEMIKKRYLSVRKGGNGG